MSEKEISTQYTRDMVCPHCGYVEPNPNEWSSDDGDAECGSCGETFEYARDIDVTYCTNKKA